jgi:hypothetical protein
MLLGVASPLGAQVFEIGGGTSSLYQAGGGSVTIHGSGYDLTLGAGTVDGHLLEGGRILKTTPNGTYVFGDDRIDFRLPTDVFDTSHFLLVRGAGFSGIRHEFDAVAFLGTMSTEYDSPFFNGAKMGQPVGILFVKRRFNRRWQLFSDSVVGKKVTQIEALAWSPAPKTEVSLAAGLGANHPFGSASLTMERPKFDLKTAYIAAGSEFHRIASPSVVIAEPYRENVMMTYRPLSFFSMAGSHQNYLVPVLADPTNILSPSNLGSLTNAKSSVDQGSLSLHQFGAQFNGTIYHSSYDEPEFADSSNHAVALSAFRDFGSRVHWNSSYLVSKPNGVKGTSSLISSFTEMVTSRLSVTENWGYSNGQSSVTFGGQFLSNTLSLSANYDTFYVPAQNDQPFEQALLLDVKFKVLGRLLLHGASFVDPTGRMRYTGDASTVFSHTQGVKPLEYTLGRYVLHGCVQDSDGQPVEGAAVLIDERPLYTDSKGCFYLRESKARTHQMRVVIGDFLVAGNWQVIMSPTTVTSTTEDLSNEMKIVVIVRKVREISGVPGEAPAESSGGMARH